MLCDFGMSHLVNLRWPIINGGGKTGIDSSQLLEERQIPTDNYVGLDVLLNFRFSWLSDSDSIRWYHVISGISLSYITNMI